ncbi:gustatory and odorant receptor 22 [Sitophilus oryzae]|uniref:Gustatory receptor n=1 Tax=Sitophilus oryzae TaxID=7048 RepID=A0A6J2X4F3_SITOR|nr:gustatory and odorant receptor 22 [Sitophilus oryzae]
MINEKRKCSEKANLYHRRDEGLDYNLLDYYDSFYHTTKSLLVLFQVMGVMPIERNKGYTTFRWHSPAILWSYLLFTGETIFVSLVFKSRLDLIMQPGKPFDEYVYGIIFLSILIPHFLLPLVAWSNGAEVVKFKNMWTRYQLKYLQVTGDQIVFHNLECVCNSLCLVSWLVGVVIMIAQYYLQPDMLLWHTFGYYHILAMLNGLVSLWYINTNSMGKVAGRLAVLLNEALLEGSAEKVEDYRDIWVDLSHMLQQFGKAYSGLYACMYLLVPVTTIVATFGCVTEILDHGLSLKEAGLFIIAIYCCILLFIFCNEAYRASNKMGSDFRDILMSIDLNTVDNRIVQEVNMFLIAIQKNPPIMNLNGYTNINRKLLSTTATSVATYLVILMQFRMTLMRNSVLSQRANKTMITEAQLL